MKRDTAAKPFVLLEEPFHLIGISREDYDHIQIKPIYNFKSSDRFRSRK